MVHVFRLTLVLFIICVLQTCQSTEYPNSDLNPESLFKFYENAYSLVPFTNFLKVYNSETEFDSWETEMRLSKISVENYITKKWTKFKKLLENYIFNKKIEDLLVYIRQVEDLYNEYIKFRKYLKKTQKENVTLTFETYEYEDYVYRVFRSNMYGIAEKLDDIRYFITQESTIDALVRKLEKPRYSCKQKLSHVQMIEDLLKQFVILETKGFLIISFGYYIKEKSYKDDFSLDKQILINRCIKRHDDILKKFKRLLDSGSDRVYVCDKKRHQHDETYVEFRNLFQKEKKSVNDSEYGFSLDVSLAKFNANYVVTGARLVKYDNVIQIELQEGKLLPYGGIDPNTVAWSNIKKDNKVLKNVYTLRWSNTSVNLHNLKVPKNNVIVGLSFVDQLTFGKSHLALSVHYLPFNFTNGTLVKNTEVAPSILTYNYSNYNSTPNRLHLPNKDIPIKTQSNRLDSKDNEFLQFQTTLLQKDGLQHIVPFIDTQEIVCAIRTPLSGVGLVHRGTSTSGGFLGLNLFTYNIAPHIETEEDVSQADILFQMYSTFDK